MRRYLMRFSIITILVGGVILVGISLLLYWIFLQDIGSRGMELRTPNVLVETDDRRIDLDKIIKKYVDLQSANGSEIALATLKKDLKNDKLLARNCHTVVHELGQNALEKYGSFEVASQYQDAVCNSGFIHGVIEAKFKGSTDINADMGKVCENANQNRYVSWECWHGVGHGVMFYTSNNLPIALQFCQSLPSSFSRSNCINGVYMENFNGEQTLHPSAYVRDNDPFYPCNDDNFSDHYSCYYNSAIRLLELNHHNYELAFKKCDEEAGKFSGDCRAGVVGQAVKDNFDDLTDIEKICASRPEDQQVACIKHAVTMVVNMHGNIADAKLFCEQISKANFKQYCQEQILSNEAQFKNTESRGVRFSN